MKEGKQIPPAPQYLNQQAAGVRLTRAAIQETLDSWGQNGWELQESSRQRTLYGEA